MTAQQALDQADVVIAGKVVRKEPAHSWFVRAWSRHAPLWLGGNPLSADRAVAYVQVTDAIKGAVVDAQVPVRTLPDDATSTCTWDNLHVGQAVLLFTKNSSDRVLFVSHGSVPLDVVESKAVLDELKRLSRPAPPNKHMQRSGKP
jgi:hypothetical protein